MVDTLSKVSICEGNISKSYLTIARLDSSPGPQIMYSVKLKRWHNIHLCGDDLVWSFLSDKTLIIILSVHFFLC